MHCVVDFGYSQNRIKSVHANSANLNIATTFQIGRYLKLDNYNDCVWQKDILLDQFKLSDWCLTRHFLHNYKLEIENN